MKLINSIEKEFLIFFKWKDVKKKTFNIKIYNKDSMVVGFIYWKAQWRTYVFEALSDMIFDTKCLKEIVEYIDELMKERRKQNESNK